MTENTTKILDLQSLISITQNKNIGILGGSFNPAHTGHLHISLQALKQINLDYVIWLVANQNPFKPSYGVSIFQRADYASKIAFESDKIFVSTAESEIDSTNTYKVLKALVDVLNIKSLTWIMGIDNLQHFDRWENFDLIPQICNIAIFDRPSYLNEELVKNLKFKFQHLASKLSNKVTIYISDDLSDESSTSIRNSLK